MHLVILILAFYLLLISEKRTHPKSIKVKHPWGQIGTRKRRIVMSLRSEMLEISLFIQFYLIIILWTYILLVYQLLLSHM